jgi:DNA-binding FadR family transcriptional regulator
MRLHHALFGPLDDAGGRREAVARRLGGAIALGLLGDGEQLPSDGLSALSRERLTEMGVSDLREIGDLHVAVAGTAARLAAERASEAEIERLRHLVTRLGEARGAADVRRIDGRLHIEMAASAQSARLTMMEIELQGELAQLTWQASSGRSGQALAEERRGVVDAIARRQPDRARRLVEAQLGDETLRLIDVHIRLMRGRVGTGEVVR